MDRKTKEAMKGFSELYKKIKITRIEPEFKNGTKPNPDGSYSASLVFDAPSEWPPKVAQWLAERLAKKVLGLRNVH